MNSGRDSHEAMGEQELLDVLRQSLDAENELLRTYVIASERIDGNDELKERLRNFAEGNAKRTKQLMDEIAALEGH